MVIASSGVFIAEFYPSSDGGQSAGSVGMIVSYRYVILNQRCGQSFMTKFFCWISIFTLSVYMVTLALGFTLDDTLASPQLRVHFLFGLFSAMLVMLAQGVIVTYFIGTTRWCKEVTEAYALDPLLLRRSTRLKRRTFPWAVVCMLYVIAVAALGAAADPHNTLVEQTTTWGTPHLVAAAVGLFLLGGAFYLQWNHAAEQHRVIEEVLAEVKRIREERGLAD